MAQDFFTVHGKVVVERDKLFIRTIKPRPFTETPLFHIVVGLLSIAVFVTCFFIEDPRRRVMNFILSVALLGRWVLPLYTIVFKTSLADRIPFSRIRAFALHPDPSGLETALLLHLMNGRERKIIFRLREKEWEGLSQVLISHDIHLLSDSAGVENLQVEAGS